MTWNIVGGFATGAIACMIGYWQGRRHERKLWMAKLKMAYHGVMKRDVQ